MVYDTVMAKIKDIDYIPTHAKRVTGGALAGAISVLVN
jgi:hypothetical protein